ncbi:MAG: DUF47 domain-containing protein [Acidimicrobiales bacterium]
MWELASKAYAERSRDVGFLLSDADDELDELSAALLSEGAAGGAVPAVAAELALVARFYERLGDHAVNLARRVDSMVAPRRMSPLRALGRRAREPAPNGSKPRGKLASAFSQLLHLKLVPADERFFDLFEEAAVNGRDCAEELRKMIVSFTDFDEHYQEIRMLERRGDQITVELLRRLDASFVTPYDREDIHALTEELDDVVDDMFAAAAVIQLVHVGEPLPEVGEMADILAGMASEMEGLISCMQSRSGARQRLERIESLEREGDATYRRIMARLFSGEYAALEVLKWKDIVQALENAINRIEDVSDVVESILVKNS